MRKVLVLFSALFVVVAACGGDKGDDCSEEGKVLGECDSGFVCGRAHADQGGDLVCLTVCDTSLNCETSEQCVGVGKTALKGCRPK